MKSNKIAKALLICSSCFLLTPLFAQEQVNSDRAKIGIYTSAGVHFPKVKELNKVLTQNNYAAISKAQESVGLGFSRTKNRLTYQLDFYMYFECAESEQDICSDIFGSGLSLNLGYDLLANKKWQFSPLAGITFDRTVFKTSDNTTPQSSFNSYFAEARN